MSAEVSVAGCKRTLGEPRPSSIRSESFGVGAAFVGQIEVGSLCAINGTTTTVLDVVDATL
eukprot:6638958-Prorocentrum_lima.AAC.1